MTDWETIVVYLALDGRDAATAGHAARVARAAGPGAVTFVHVAPTFDPPADGSGGPVDEAILARLERARDAYGPHFPAGTRIECLVREGRAREELVRLASQRSADLICLPRSRPEDADALDAEAIGLLRQSPASVLLAPAGTEPRYGRVLVPVDFSEASRRALEAALALAADEPGAAVEALHVYGVPIGSYRLGLSSAELAGRLGEEAGRRWEAWRSGLDPGGAALSARFVPGDSVPEGVLAAAREFDAGLIVMGSHGRTRPAAALLGHAADAVGARTTRPFLCVKAKGQAVTLLRALMDLYESGPESAGGGPAPA